MANVFHAGDGNMHPLILYDANNPGELERTEELGGKILELCVEVGGTITGEHGVGIEKIRQMCVQFDKDELEQFMAVKRAFDPKELLNPGKGVPTPRRCSEYRQLPVAQARPSMTDKTPLLDLQEPSQGRDVPLRRGRGGFDRGTGRADGALRQPVFVMELELHEGRPLAREDVYRSCRTCTAGIPPADAAQAGALALSRERGLSSGRGYEQ